MKKKNVYTKSMFRQPLHSLILVFLLFIATFTFVLRSVEFLTVRDEIFRIASYYQTIGFLDDIHGDGIDPALNVGANSGADVSIGADFLEDTGYLGISDRRRGVEAFIQGGMLNADVHGQHFWRFQEVPEAQFRFHDAFFYGELVDKIENPEGGWRLILSVDDVLVGYPEHVVVHQEKLQMDFDLERGDESAIADMEIGERYFLRGIFNPYASLTFDDPYTSGPSLPTIGDERNILLMLPLHSDEVWYVQVPYGEEVDFAMFGLEGVLEDVEFLYHNHRAVQLHTTVDMTVMPKMLEDVNVGFLVEGRLIDQQDYLNANPVAVIHHNFARIRNLEIGDSIAVSVPKRHNIIDVFITGDDQHRISLAYSKSIGQDDEMHEIELTIVGIYNLFRLIGGDSGTAFSTFIYIPDSVLPDDVVITSNILGNPDTLNYLPAFWYSFVLSDSRHEVAFIAESRQTLEEMGFVLTLFESGGENFWESADVILQSIWVNLIVFSIVLILILMLVNFLFLRQRRKEFTVNRVLGYSSSRSVRELFVSATLFFVPIMVGGIFAWIFAGRTVENTLQIFDEITADLEAEPTALEIFLQRQSEAYEMYETSFSLSIYPLIGLIAVVFILTIIMVLIGAKLITRRPILELLQHKG